MGKLAKLKKGPGSRGGTGAYQKDEPRMRTIGVRLTDDEVGIIVSRTPAGLRPSVWIRQLVLAAAAARKAVR